MSKEREVLLPDIGDFDSVDVIDVAVGPGDRVNIDDTLLTLESDKATMDIPSPAAGVVREMKVTVGDKVTQGALLLILTESDAAKKAPEKAEQSEAGEASSDDILEVATSSAVAGADKDGTAPAPPAESVPAAPAPAAPSLPEPRMAPSTPTGAVTVGSSRSEQAHASPAIRKFARELGVDLGLVRGSGNKGRILQEDVKGFTRAVMSSDRVFEKSGGFSLPEIPPVDFSRFGPIESRPLPRLKRLGGQNLHRSWINVPHVTQFDETDISELEAFRKSKTEAAAQEGVKLTPLTFLVKAVVVALKKFPEFNASLSPDGENLILKKYFHIGIAVNTDQGLTVPVVRDADQKGIYDLAREMAELAQKARQRKLSPAEMQGACFTISSLGHIGGTGFTPIVNTPEVAILGVSRSEMKPVYKDGEFVARLILPYSLSYDHRVIDGVAAAEFTRYLGTVLADIRHLLL